MAASAWVASSGRCRRSISMTLASVSRSPHDVDEVAATAAGITGFLAGVGAVTRRRAGGAGLATGDGRDGEANSRAAAVAVCGGEAAGTEWRATGRDFGAGSWRLASAVAFVGFLSSVLLSALLLSVVLLSVAFLSEPFFSALFFSVLFFFSVTFFSAAFVSAFSAVFVSVAGAAFSAENPNVSASATDKTVDRAVDRNGFARTIGGTAFPSGESMG